MNSQQHRQKANDPETVRAFVRQTYIEGIPFNEVKRMSPSLALPVLIKMLDDSREEQYWTNIVVTLGMLGDSRAVAPLINFITRSEERSELSPPQAVAKTSAVMSLGYIINKTIKGQALTFLAEGVDPQVWENRNIQWSSSFYPSMRERNNQLATMSILGLAISGRPEAEKILRDLQHPAPDSQSMAVRQRLPGIENVIEDAVKEHAKISRDGLQKYYEPRQRRGR
jgi:hypothetical protein